MTWQIAALSLCSWPSRLANNVNAFFVSNFLSVCAPPDVCATPVAASKPAMHVAYSRNLENLIVPQPALRFLHGALWGNNGQAVYMWEWTSVGGGKTMLSGPVLHHNSKRVTINS